MSDWTERAGTAGAAFALPVAPIDEGATQRWQTKPLEGVNALLAGHGVLVAWGAEEARLLDPDSGEPRLEVALDSYAELRLAKGVLLVAGGAGPRRGRGKVRAPEGVALTALDADTGDVLHALARPEGTTWVGLAPGLLAIASADGLAVHDHPDPRTAPSAAPTWTWRPPAGREPDRSDRLPGLRLTGDLLLVAHRSSTEPGPVQVVALDRRTGAPRWELPGWDPSEVFGGVWNTADGTCMADQAGVLVHGPGAAWSLHDLAGRRLHHDASGTWTPQALGATTILASTRAEPVRMALLDRATGAVRCELIELSRMNACALADGAPCVTGQLGGNKRTLVLAFDPAGHERFRAELTLGTGWINALACAPGRLYAITNTGRVYAYA